MRGQGGDAVRGGGEEGEGGGGGVDAVFRRGGESALA